MEPIGPCKVIGQGIKIAQLVVKFWIDVAVWHIATGRDVNTMHAYTLPGAFDARKT